MPAPPNVLSAARNGLQTTLERLRTLSRIPSVSAAGFPPEEVKRCAEAVATTLKSTGLEHVEVIQPKGAHPYVVGDWLHAGADRPTLLLYAHYDVQPPGRLERWKSPPFEPTEREGRLFGRGVVDDKAGLMVLIGALEAWLASQGELPVNIKLVVEGEEETGSVHLAEFLASHRERLAADVIVLTDTANLEAGLPSLTTSLRGLVNLDVHVKALDHPLHSGIWGGPVRDAASALTILLGRLFTRDGEIAVPGFEDDVPTISSSDRKALEALPFDALQFRSDAGMVSTAQLYDDRDSSAYERLWLRPSLSITALEAMPLAEAANQLIDEAAARVGIRLAPGQDPHRMRERVTSLLEQNPPHGVEVTITCEASAPGWRRDTHGKEMDAARRALALGYGREVVCIGCGGSIPFVGPFSEVLDGAPALLLGLEDPICNAHGENESLHLGDFESALLAATHLLEELSRYPLKK